MLEGRKVQCSKKIAIKIVWYHTQVLLFLCCLVWFVFWQVTYFFHVNSIVWYVTLSSWHSILYGVLARYRFLEVNSMVWIRHFVFFGILSGVVHKIILVECVRWYDRSSLVNECHSLILQDNTTHIPCITILSYYSVCFVTSTTVHVKIILLCLYGMLYMCFVMSFFLFIILGTSLFTVWNHTQCICVILFIIMLCMVPYHPSWSFM